MTGIELQLEEPTAEEIRPLAEKCTAAFDRLRRIAARGVRNPIAESMGRLHAEVINVGAQKAIKALERMRRVVATEEGKADGICKDHR